MAVLEQVGPRPAELALFQSQRTVGGVADRRLVLFGYAEQVTDRAHRDLGSDVGDEVEPTGFGERFERAHAVLARQRLDRLHSARRENP